MKVNKVGWRLNYIFFSWYDFESAYRDFPSWWVTAIFSNHFIFGIYNKLLHWLRNGWFGMIVYSCSSLEVVDTLSCQLFLRVLSWDQKQVWKKLRLGAYEFKWSLKLLNVLSWPLIRYPLHLTLITLWLYCGYG